MWSVLKPREEQFELIWGLVWTDQKFRERERKFVRLNPYPERWQCPVRNTGRMSQKSAIDYEREQRWRSPYLDLKMACREQSHYNIELIASCYILCIKNHSLEPLIWDFADSIWTRSRCMTYTHDALQVWKIGQIQSVVENWGGVGLRCSVCWRELAPHWMVI